MFGEEGEAMAATVRIGPPLEQARDLAVLHLLLKLGHRDAEAVGDDGRFDLNDAVLEFDLFHVAPAAGLPLGRAGYTHSSSLVACTSPFNASLRAATSPFIL